MAETKTQPANAAVEKFREWESMADREGRDLSLVALVAQAMAREAVAKSDDIQPIFKQGMAFVDKLHDLGRAEDARALEQTLYRLQVETTELAATVGAETARQWRPETVWRDVLNRLPLGIVNRAETLAVTGP